MSVRPGPRGGANAPWSSNTPWKMPSCRSSPLARPLDASPLEDVWRSEK